MEMEFESLDVGLKNDGDGKYLLWVDEVDIY